MSQPDSPLENTEINTIGTNLVLPLAAIISLVISCYVFIVLVGFVFRQTLVQACCSNDSTGRCNCDICPSGFYGCCKSLGCCNAKDSSKQCCSDRLLCCGSEFCGSSSQSIDCQSCDCCCFEIACHLKRSASKADSPT